MSLRPNLQLVPDEPLPELEWDDVVSTLRNWSGRRVVAVPIFNPGAAFRPFHGTMTVEGDGTERVTLRIPTDPPNSELVSPDGVTLAVRRDAFHGATWVRGRVGSGLSIGHGAVRIDVFVDGDQR